MHREVDRFELAPAQPVHLEHRLGVGARGGGGCVVDDSSGHQLDERALRQAGHRKRRHLPPVAQHRDAIGDGEDLVEVVGDVQHPDAPVAHPPDDLEQPLRLGLGHRRRRLVEDEQRHVAIEALQRPGDGDRRALDRLQPASGPTDVDVVADGLDGLSRGAELAAPADPREATGVVAEPERDVVDGVQRRHQAEVLVHEPQAAIVGGLGVTELVRAPRGLAPMHPGRARGSQRGA